MRGTPNTFLSQEELARRVFYVGQTGDLERRLNDYYDTLTGPINEMNKREVSETESPWVIFKYTCRSDFGMNT